MTSPLAPAESFELSIGGKSAIFKVESVSGDNFTAKLQSEITGSFGANLKAGLIATYSAVDQTIALAGKAMYEGIEMDFSATYDVSEGTNFQEQTAQAALLDGNKPTLIIDVSTLFGETDSLVKGANVSGAYNTTRSNYDWTGNLKLDFTPRDTTNNDEINVSLSNLVFGQDQKNNNRGFLNSVTLSLSQDDGNALTLGGVTIEPNSLTITYSDNRLTSTNKQYTKKFDLNLDGDATWGLETTTEDDDFKLGLSGSGSYSQIYTSEPIPGKPATNGANSSNPIKIKSGLTAFSANATGKGAIDLGPIALAPKNAAISYAADLDKNYGLWNISGLLGLQLGFIPDAQISLGNPANVDSNQASEALQAILAKETITYPTAGVWSLGEVAADLHSSNDKPLVDLGLVSVDGLKLELMKSDQNTSPELNALGFYKFVNNNSTQQSFNPSATATQNANKTLKASVKGVKINSAPLVNALSGTADIILDVLSPVKPIVDFFTQDVTIFDDVDQALKDPIVSFLESTPNNQFADGKVQAVEFVDVALAAKSMLSIQPVRSITPAVKAAENVFTTLDLISNLQGQDSVKIDLGDFSYSYPLAKLKPSKSAANNTGGVSDPSNDRNVTATDTDPNLQTFKRTLSANTVPDAPNPNNQAQPLFTATSKVDFPIVSDPIRYVSDYFTKGSADLFSIDLGLGFNQSFEASVPIPAFPVVKVGVEGGVNANIATSIKSSLSSDSLKKIANNRDVSVITQEILKGTGIDLEETSATFGANIGLSIGVDAYIASLKLIGGLQGNLSIKPVLKIDGEKAQDQTIYFGNSSSLSKPTYIQPSIRLRDLTLELNQKLDAVTATGETPEVAYAKNTWLLTIGVEKLDTTKLDSTLRASLGESFNTVKLIELDKNLIDASGGYSNPRINFSALNDQNSTLYMAVSDALKFQLKEEHNNELTAMQLSLLVSAFANSSPKMIEYSTIDASSKETDTSYLTRKKYLLQNKAFLLEDGTSKKDGTNINSALQKREFDYYYDQSNFVKTSNYYLPLNSILNQNANDHEIVVKVNAKLTEAFNSIFFDIATASRNSNTTVEIFARGDSRNWHKVGQLNRSSSNNLLPNLTGNLNDHGLELIASDENRSGASTRKLLINISPLNAPKSTPTSQDIITAATKGTLEFAFNYTVGNSTDIAFSEPRIIQGGAVSIGLENSLSEPGGARLLTNLLTLDENGRTTQEGDLRAFTLIAQPTDILNPVEWSQSKSLFGGVSETSVRLDNHVNSATNTNSKFDTLALVNSINRASVADFLSTSAPEISSNFSTRQTVDPVSGNIYLSYIAKNGLISLAVKQKNSNEYKFLHSLNLTENAIFDNTTGGAPDIVAYNGKVLGVQKASESGKIARFLFSESTILTDKSLQHQGNNISNLRIGIIPLGDVKSNSTSNELTIAISYKSDSVDPGNGILNYFPATITNNVNSSTSAYVPDLDLTTGFNNIDKTNFSSGLGYNGIGSDNLVDMDFMEFGSTNDLVAYLRRDDVNKSTLFSLEQSKDDSNQLVVYRASQRKTDDLVISNLPKIKDTNGNNFISVVYQKQPESNDDLPPFINNWKGTSLTNSRAASSNFQDFALSITGRTDFTATYNLDSAGSAYFGLNKNLFNSNIENTNVVYLYSSYNGIKSANAAQLRLGSHATSKSETARQNTNNAPSGLSWTWYPMLGSAARESNVATNTNADSDGYLKQGTSTVVALAGVDVENPVNNFAKTILDNNSLEPFLNLSSKSFQILPDSSGSYLLSSFTTNTDKVEVFNVSKAPNYETALITTRHDFETPSDSKALIDSFFNGTQPFVNQGEWAPIGLDSSADGVRIGDMRAPILVPRPTTNPDSAPVRFNNSQQSINVGSSYLWFDYSNTSTVNNAVDILISGQSLSSKNGKYTLAMQANGELILFENTANGRAVLWNINDFVYEADPTKTLLPGYSATLNKHAIEGSIFRIVRAVQSRRETQYDPSVYFLCLSVPKDAGGYYDIPLNPVPVSTDNLIFVSPQDISHTSQNMANKSKYSLNDRNTDATPWKTLPGRSTFDSQFDSFEISNNGDLLAKSISGSTLFWLPNWRAEYYQDEATPTSLTDSTPLGFNGLVNGVVADKIENPTPDFDQDFFNALLGTGSVPQSTSYELLKISPDLASTSKFIPASQVRDVVSTGSGKTAILVANQAGKYSKLSDVITWGPSAPPANQLRSLLFRSNVNILSSPQNLQAFVDGIWADAMGNQNSANYKLLNDAIPLSSVGFDKARWINQFNDKYSALQALSVLPVVSSKSYFSVPTVELTPRTAEVTKDYDTYLPSLDENEERIDIEANFSLDAFVKIVASFAWWDAELLNLTFPLLSETWSLKVGYAAGGPGYGSQQIFLDRNRNLVADSGEATTVNTDASFSFDLSSAVDALKISAGSPLNVIWDGKNYVNTPPESGYDFRTAGLLAVAPSSPNSFNDTATGLPNNKIYLALPESDRLVANIWTSIKYSSVLDYEFFPTEATDSAKADFLSKSRVRYSSDPYFVTKLTPKALDLVISQRLAGIPAAYSTRAGDTFDVYNGMVVSDKDVAAQAFEAFRFTSRFTFVLEAVERLLNRLQPDTAHWGQADSLKERRSLISCYQLIPYLAMAVEGQLDAYYSNALKIAAAGQSDILAAIESKTFKLDLSNANHLHLLLRFACLTVPTLLGQSNSLFNEQGRLNLDDPDLGSKLGAQALGLAQVAKNLAALTSSYDALALTLFKNDPRLVTALLAPVKRSALEAGGLIDTILTAMPTANPTDNLGSEFQALVDTAMRNRPVLNDTTRIASITEALVNDFHSNGKPVEQTALRISLNHAAPPGGTVVPLTYTGSAVYGTDYMFEGNNQRPGYVFIPFGETNVVVPIVQPNSSTKDWSITIGIEDPSSSFNVSADINRVLVRFNASKREISLYDNNVIVRMSDDPAEPNKLVSASPEDRTFDYDFYKDSRVVGIEAVDDPANGLVAKALQYYVSSRDSQISIYATKMPAVPPVNGGQWLLINDDVMQVYEGDAGPTDIVQFYNSTTGRYGYAPAGDIFHVYQGSSWQNQGIEFSLRQFNREIAEAIGTITAVANVGTSFQFYPERSSLEISAINQIKALGVAENQINANSLRLKTQLASHQKGRSSIVLDLASVADRIWDPEQGLPGRFVSSFNVRADGSVLDSSYNPSSGAGARFYSLYSSSGSLDTVVFDVADGVNDADGLVNNQLDATTATAFAATFNPRLQANDGALQLLDVNQATTPLVGGVKIFLKSRGMDVQDLRYTVLAAGETVADLLKLSPAALEVRSRLLFSSLENTDVTLLPSEKAAAGSAFSQTIPLSNGQQLLLLERSGRQISGNYQVVPLPSGLAAATTQSLTTPGGLSLTLEISTSVSRLPDFLGRDQQQASVLNFTGLDGQKVGFDVELAREADYNATLGFYRVIDSQGTVRDTVTGAVITPGDIGYAEAALSTANRPNLRPFAVADNATDIFTGQTVQEAALLAPYGQLGDGTTLFAFAAANPDGRSHFKVLGQNIFGFEDLLSTNSDFDFDDHVLAIRTPTIIG